MHRRAIRILATAVLVLVASIGASGPAALAEPDPAPTPSTTVPEPTPEPESDPAPEPPATIAEEFLPESANLSDCVGFVERPGCGAEGRGGTGQTLAFVALAAGLGLVGWRVAVGVRRNRGN